MIKKTPIVKNKLKILKGFHEIYNVQTSVEKVNIYNMLTAIKSKRNSQHPPGILKYQVSLPDYCSLKALTKNLI